MEMWQRIRFFPGEVSKGKHRELRNTMLRAYNQKGRPSKVALFSTPLLPSGEIFLYFSPAAGEVFAKLTHAYRMRPCEKPVLGEVKLVLGKPQDANNLLEDPVS